MARRKCALLLSAVLVVLLIAPTLGAIEDCDNCLGLDDVVCSSSGAFPTTSVVCQKNFPNEPSSNIQFSGSINVGTAECSGWVVETRYGGNINWVERMASPMGSVACFPTTTATLPMKDDGGEVRLRMTGYTCISGPCEDWEVKFTFTICADYFRPEFTAPVNSADWGLGDSAVFTCGSKLPLRNPPQTSDPPATDNCFNVNVYSEISPYEFHDGTSWSNSYSPMNEPRGSSPNCRLNVKQVAYQVTNFGFRNARSTTKSPPSSGITVFDTSKPTVTFDAPEIWKECTSTLSSYLNDVVNNNRPQFFTLADNCFQDSALQGRILAHSSQLAGTGLTTITSGCGTNSIEEAEWTIAVTDMCGWYSELATVIIHWVDTTIPNASPPTMNPLIVPMCMGYPITPGNLEMHYLFDHNEVNMYNVYDSCSNVDVVVNYTDALVSCSGGTATIDRTHAATDGCGNTRTFTQSIEAPVGTITFSLIEPATVECTGASPSSRAGIIRADDSCLGDVTSTVLSTVTATSTRCPGELLEMINVEANNGCSTEMDSFTVGTVDTTAPSFVGFPSDRTLECGVSQAQPDSTGTPSATDTCTSNSDIAITHSDDVTYLCGSSYRITRNWVADDGCESTTRPQVIIMRDTTAPAMTIPADVTMECGADSDPAVIGAANATDICAPMVVPTFDDSDPPVGCGATVFRTWTADDGCRSSTAVQTLRLNDTTPPTVIAPPDTTLECGEVEAPSGAAGFAMVMDNCFSNSTVRTFLDNTTRACGNTGIIAREWIAIDQCGFTSSDVQVITVVDTTRPMIDRSSAPSGVTISCTDDLTPNGPAGMLDAWDTCGSVTVNYTDTDLSLCSGGVRTFTRQWAVTDECGLVRRYDQVINVQDNQAPMISGLSPVVNAECGFTDPVYSFVERPVVTDNCPYGFNMTFSDISFSTGCGLERDTNRTWVVTDGCYSVSAVQVLRERDTISPTLTPPPSVQYTCGAAVSNFGSATASDACSSSVVISETVTEHPGSCPNNFQTIRRFTATDQCGLTSVAFQTITSVDLIPPEYTYVPDSVELECPSDTLPALTGGVARAKDNCLVGSTVTISFTDQVVPRCGGTTNVERRWVATDSCGNKGLAYQTVLVVDSTPPALLVPPYAEVSCLSADVTPAVTGTATATDACGSTEVSYQDSSVGGCSSSKLITRVWTARDECGEETTGAQLIGVTDTVAPTLTVPPRYEVECGTQGSLAPSMITGRATATDLCALQVEVSFSDRTVFDCGDAFTVYRTWRASDGCKAVTEVQELAVVDTTKPVFGPLPALTLECNTRSVSPMAIPIPEPDASDACSSDLSFSFVDSPAAPGCGDAVSFRRTWRAEDACGNFELGQQDISTEDTTPPTISLSEVVTTIECNRFGLYPSQLPIVSDTCSDVVVTPTQTTTPQCGETLLTETVFNAEDECGNEAELVHLLVVEDTTPPALVLPLRQEFECVAGLNIGPDGGVVLRAIATDECSSAGDVVLTSEDNVQKTCGDKSPVGEYEREWTAVDACGLMSRETQTFTVVDTHPPVLVLADTTVTVECGDIDTVDERQMPTVYDVCDTDAVVLTYADLRTRDGLLRRWTATDACGNSDSVLQTVVVMDSTAPELTIPGNVEIECTGGSERTSPIATGRAVASDECDRWPDVRYSDTVIPRCGLSFTVERTWEAMDAAGNRVSATQTIDVLDRTLPAITAPADKVRECGESGVPSVVPTLPATDACSSVVSVVPSFNTVEDRCGDSAVYERVWEATDECGNVAVVRQRLTERDTTPPVIHPVASYDVPCPATGAALSPLAIPSTDADLCGTVVVTFTDEKAELGGACKANYDVRRQWVATDECGLTDSTVQTIRVRDEVPPVLSLPPDTSIECGASVAPEGEAGKATAVDACSELQEISYTDAVVASMVCGRRIEREWRAQDTCGRAAVETQIIELVDTQPPSITAPENRVVECGADTDPAGDLRNAVASDKCYAESSLVISSADLLKPSCSATTGTIERTWRATDPCGLFSEDVQTIEVLDRTAPELLVPEHAVVECGESMDPAVTGMARVQDSCDAAAAVSYVDTFTVDCGKSGVIDRRWTGSDSCGNERSLSQRINVVDSAAPVWVSTPPKELTLECGLPLTTANTGGVALAVDVCSDDVSVSFSDAASTRCGSAKVVVRTWQARDVCGHATSYRQTLTQVDTTPPVFTVASPITLSCGSSTANRILLGGTASGVPSPTLITEACSPNDVTFSFTDTYVAGCGESTTVFREWTATDACGQSSTNVQEIRIEDSTPPSLTVPRDVEVPCGASLSPATTGTARASDVCSGEVAVTFMDVDSPGPCGSDSKVVVRTWTATDECGLTTELQQQIRVTDMDPPTLVSVPAAVVLECGADTSVAALGNVTAADDCSKPSLRVSDAFEPSCGYAGVVTRTWHVLDACSESVNVTQRITLVDSTPPSLTVPASRTVECGEPIIPRTANATDQCSDMVQVTVQERTRSRCGGTYTLTRLWSAVDECLRVSSGTETVTVVDTTPPVLGGVSDVTVEYPGSVVPAKTGIAVASDSCSGTDVTYEDSDRTVRRCDAEYWFTRTWSVEDECRNVGTPLTQLIMVNDTTAPAIAVQLPTVVRECENGLGNGLGDTLFGAVDASDASDVVLSFTDRLDPPPSGGCQQYTRTWLAEDECGNFDTAEQIITICDTTPPAFAATALETIEVGCGESLDDAVPVPAVFDACSTASLSYTDTVSVASDCRQEVIRQWTVTDGTGLSSSLMQTIVMVDNEPPALTHPPDASFECGEAIPVTVLAPAAAADACDLAVEVQERVEELAVCGAARVITRRFTAVDRCGNVAESVQRVEVVDTVAPLIDVPPDSRTECGMDNSTSVATGADACGDVDISFEDLLLLSECNGLAYAVQRIWRATDACGHVSTGAQLVYVSDSSPPELAIPPERTLECGRDASPRALGEHAAAQDMCDESVSVTFFDDIVPGACGNTGTILRRWLASDACGNAAAAVQSLHIEDSKPPVFDEEVFAEAQVMRCRDFVPLLARTAMEVDEEIARDACGGVALFAFDDVERAPECLREERVTRVWEAEDACGLVSRAKQLFVLTVDGLNPVPAGGGEEQEDEGMGGDEEEDDGMVGMVGGTMLDPLNACSGLNNIAFESCLVASKVVQVSEEERVVKLEVDGKELGQIELPPSAVGSLLVVGRSFAPDVKRESASVEITLVSAEGREQALDGDAEICLTLDEETSRNDLCLAYYDIHAEEWKCEEDCLESDGDDGRRCAKSPHLTSFAILLGEQGGGSTDCGGTNGWITGEWKWDFLLIVLTIGFVVVVAVLVLMASWTKLGTGLIYGTEGARVRAQRLEMKKKATGDEIKLELDEDTELLSE